MRRRELEGEKEQRRGRKIWGRRGWEEDGRRGGRRRGGEE